MSPMSPSPYLSPSAVELAVTALDPDQFDRSGVADDLDASVRSAPAEASFSASPAQVAAALRATPRGRLRYDRGPGVVLPSPGKSSADGASPLRSPPSPRSPASSLSPPSRPSLTSQLSQNASFQSVLEEVAEEMQELKMREVAEATRDLNRSLGGRSNGFKITLGPDAEKSPGNKENARVPVVEEEIVPVKAYLCGTSSAGKVKSEKERKPVVEEDIVPVKAYLCGSTPKSSSKGTRRVPVVEEEIVPVKTYVCGTPPSAKSKESRVPVVEEEIVPEKAYWCGTPTSPKTKHRVPVVEEKIVPAKAYLCGTPPSGKTKNRVPVVEEEIVPEKAYLCGSSTPKPVRKTAEDVDLTTVTRMASSPTSPEDEMLLRMERRREKELEDSKRKRGSQFRGQLQSIRSQSDLAKRERLESVQRENEEAMARLEREAETASQMENAAARQKQDEAKRRAEQRQASLRALEQQKEAEERRLWSEGELDKLRTAVLQAGAAPTDGIEGAAVCVELRRAVAEANDIVNSKAAEKADAAVNRLNGLLGDVIKEKGLHDKRLKEQAAVAKAQAEEAEKAKREKEEQERILREKQQQQQQQQQLQEQKRLAEMASKPEATTAQTVPQGSVPNTECSATNRRRFEELQAFKADWKSKLEPFMQDANVRSFRFSCQKAVNTPVNAISATSSTFLKEKLGKLRSLLAGEDVEVTGKTVKASQHPAGVAYCMDLLAKKFVNQGEEVVSSKPEYAFAYAASIVSLWAEFPDFGRLFLAHLFEACPYLVPCHFVQGESETQEQHYRRLGYKYDDAGAVEEQTKYVKRIGGLGRLYAAVCAAHLPQRVAETADHPHGVGHVWSWLASVFNLQPVNDVTATLIHDIVEVAGNALCENYKGMFVKMLEVLQADYFPRVQQVTLAGSGGPVTRLEEFLKKCIADLRSEARAIRKPAQELSPDFL